MIGLLLLGITLTCVICGGVVGYLFFSDETIIILAPLGGILIAGVATYWLNEIRGHDPVMAMMFGLTCGMCFSGAYGAISVLRSGSFLSDN